MYYKGNRLRSRTPPGVRSTGECLYCCEPITQREKWVCFVCNVQAHKACQEKNRSYANALPGCPACRTTKENIVMDQKLFPAVKGIVCYICRGVVHEGHPCDMCLGGRDFCQAHWHPKCMWPQFRQDQPNKYKAHRAICPACGKSKWRAMDERRK